MKLVDSEGRRNRTPPIGVNIRVTGHSSRGDRKRMEDTFSVACQQTPDGNDLEYAFFGIFDGHGGKEASQFAKEHLMDTITRQTLFSSEKDEDVLQAIKNGFVDTHHAMLNDVHNWTRTMKGFRSAAGTTASVCFIKRGKLFVGHCGDSGIILGQNKNKSSSWTSVQLTKDHKPNDEAELRRIESCGGQVALKNNIPRVVWRRPIKPELEDSVDVSVPVEHIPFLAVARSLGDLWSYNADEDAYVVSPEPDVSVHNLDPAHDRCIVLVTDGALNVMTAQDIITDVTEVERQNEHHIINPDDTSLKWTNPSKHLVTEAISRWNRRHLSADNTSAVTIMLDPPGPSRVEILRRNRTTTLPATAVKSNGSFAIVSRYPNSTDARAKIGESVVLGVPSQTDVAVSHVLLTDSDDTMAKRTQPPPRPPKSSAVLEKAGMMVSSVRPELPPRNTQATVTVVTPPVSTDVCDENDENVNTAASVGHSLIEPPKHSASARSASSRKRRQPAVGGNVDAESVRIRRQRRLSSNILGESLSFNCAVTTRSRSQSATHCKQSVHLSTNERDVDVRHLHDNGSRPTAQRTHLMTKSPSLPLLQSERRWCLRSTYIRDTASTCISTGPVTARRPTDILTTTRMKKRRTMF